MAILAQLNFVVFLGLSLIHFYWSFGGTWAMDVAVPTNENGTTLFNPSKLGTFIVAVGLLLFGWINLTYIGCLTVALPATFFKYAILLIAVIFAIRCIGDFRYVGFSKRFKKSSFANLDSKFYSPLCLFLTLSHCLLFCSDLL